MVTVFSMVVVFITLLIISFILDGFKVMSRENKKSRDDGSTRVSEPDVSSPSSQEDPEELVAVIAAAIAKETSTAIENIKIKTIKRVENNTPVWARVGRQQIEKGIK